MGLISRVSSRTYRFLGEGRPGYYKNSQKMGWFTKTPQTPQEKVDAINTDHLPEELRPQKPDFSALGAKQPSLGDLSKQLQAAQSVAGGSGGSKEPPREVKYKGIEYEGLERAARAAKELANSKHSQEAIELAHAEEKTKQLETEAQVKQYEMQIKQQEHQHTRIKGEEERKTQAERMHLQKEHSKFEDQLARRRDSDRMEAEKQTQADILAAQEQSLRKQEEMRRATLTEEMRLRRENDVAAAEAAAAAKAKYDAQNHEIRMQQIQLEARERRKGWVEVATTIGTSVKDMGAEAFSSENALKTVGVIGLMAAGIYGAKNATQAAGKVAISRLLQPVLVRKTNRISPANWIKHPVKSAALLRANHEARKSDVAQAIKNKIVVNPTVFGQITDIAIGAENTIKNEGFLRNVLLHGPPGTGKTLFAENLAAHGSAAVSEMLNLFDWAEASNSGLILFIDEADAFLRKRNDQDGQMSESMRATVNAFLQRTGTPSKKVMVVLASNQPEQLDWAISDRMDTNVHFALPSFDERLRLLNILYDKKVLNGVVAPTATGFKRLVPKMFQSSRKIDIEDDVIDNQDQIMSDLGQKTEGLSGRQLDKMVTAWEHGMYADMEGKLRRSHMYECLDAALEDHKTRMSWTDEFEASARTKKY